MIFNTERSLESICGVEISDDEDGTEEDDEKYFTVQVKSEHNTPAKKKKRSRFAIGTPTKILEQAKKTQIDKENIKKHPSGMKKKSPQSNVKKKTHLSKAKENFFEMIFLCTKCKKKFVSQENLEKHMLCHKK